MLAGLEAEGYACWPCVVGAWAVGAPHKRDRVWIVAYRNGLRGQWRGIGPDESPGDSSRGPSGNGDEVGGIGTLAHRPRQPGDERPDGDGTGQCGEPPVADTDQAGRQEHSRLAGDTRPQCETPLGSRWPVRPGEPQHDWEAPRLIPLRGIHPAVRAFLRKAGPTLVEQSRTAEATEIEMAALADSILRKFVGWVGERTHGVPAPVRRRANKSMLRLLGNAWVYPLAEIIFRALNDGWIKRQGSVSVYDSSCFQ